MPNLAGITGVTLPVHVSHSQDIALCKVCSERLSLHILWPERKENWLKGHLYFFAMAKIHDLNDQTALDMKAARRNTSIHVDQVRDFIHR